nr:ATP-binding protein [Ferroacidibacillus organovorans]
MCYNFFQEIDSVLETRYYEKHSGSRKSVEELMPIMANIAATLGLGVLVIDEIQRLRSASSGGDQVMLNFFVKLTNTIGVPIVLVGTYQILPILARDFSQVRRVSSQGDLIWSPLKEDEEWDYFIEYIWEYQWTKTPTVLTRQLSKVLYYESAGIVDLAIKLYMITQIELITEEDGEEKITPSFIRKVAESRFVLIQSMLKALRNNDLESLKKIQDIAPGIESLNEYLEKASQPTNLKGTIATVRNVEKSGTSTLSAEITRWLIEGGYGSEIASEATRRALENNQFENDLKMVRHEAYALAQRLTENPGFPVKERKEAKKTLTTKKPLGQYQGLIEIYEEAKHKKIVVVDLLKERGFLRPVSELFNSN